jgi:hypothetical protein
MALANRLQHYTKNAEQFLRLFHASGLGKRDKAYRSDYVQRTLLKAFDRTLPPLQIEGEAEGLAILEEKRRARDAASVGQGVPWDYQEFRVWPERLNIFTPSLG